VMGYQSLKAELSAVQNSRTGANTWEKIVSQLGPLIDNFRVAPEKEVINVEVASDSAAEDLTASSSKAVSTAAKNPAHKSASGAESPEILSVRRNEIERLKSQIASQFEDIFHLQSALSKKASSTDNPMAGEVNEGLESITRQLKDAELCITMMDAEIQTASEEILDLKEQLENTQSSQPGGAQPNELSEQLAKKDEFINRTMQENKEMMTLIEGMEKHSDEQTQEIKELEAELEKLRS